MKSKYQNGEAYYNGLYVLFNGFIAVSLLPMGWLLLEKQSNQLIPVIIDNILLWTFIISMLAAIGALVYVSRRKFIESNKSSCSQQTLRAKLDAFKQASIKKYFEFLLAGLLCVMGMWMTANTLFLVGYIITLIFLSLGRPTLSAFIEDLKLNKEEEAILLEKKPIE